MFPIIFLLIPLFMYLYLNVNVNRWTTLSIFMMFNVGNKTIFKKHLMLLLYTIEIILYYIILNKDT